MWTSSSSSSTSTLSTSLPSSPSTMAALPRTMKEVWKDITLAADLRRHPSTPGVILQDFFSRDPPPTSVSPPVFSASPPPPPTMLTLNSGSDRFGSLLLQHPSQQIHGIPHISAGFDAVVLDENGGGGGGGGKKRFPEFERGSGDRRHKRMIKNRESAARSRARKQAYTNELEQEVANLLEENARLKKQQEELHRAAAAENLKRKPLHRTSTAPF